MTTDVLGFSAYLLLSLIGLVMWRIPAVRGLPLDARLAVAFAGGALLTAVVMMAASLLGIGWSRTLLYPLLGLVAAVGLYRVNLVAEAARERPHFRFAQVGILLFTFLSAYGLLTARQTCGDLEFFWGPKGIKFFRAGGIDVSFLREPSYVFMHADYPPLVPLLYAWSNLVSHHFSWWGAVLLALVCLAASVALVRSFSGDDRGAFFISAILAYAFAKTFVAGGADPVLLLFETLTLVALTFVDDMRSQSVLASIGLAGAVLTKVEGATFAIAVVLSIILIRRQFGRAILIALPALALLGTWLLFVIRNRMLDTYGGAGDQVEISLLPKVLQLTASMASYGVFWAPWIACIALIVIGRNLRRAALPLLVGLLTIGATIFFYLHGADPTWLILTSGGRVLLTPLLAFTIAAVAATPPATLKRSELLQN